MVNKPRGAATNRSFYLLIAVLAIGGIAALTYASRHKPETVTLIDTTLPKVISQGYVIGSPTAPVEVTEFGDFECPVCANFAIVTEPDIRARLVNTGKVRMRFVDYPLPMHGSTTWNASRAAACADEQGRFWEMHDALFQSQDRWGVGSGNTNPDKVFKELAKPIVANADQFNSCVDTKKYQAKIQAHERLASAAKAQGTPTFVIGKLQIGKPLTYDEFKAYVDTATANAAATATPSLGDTAKGTTLTKKK